MQSFAFDAENKTKTVNGETDVYRYDGDGNRVRKNFAAGEKVRMVYSGSQLIAEYDLSNGSLKKEYVYGAKGLIATIEPANGTQYTTADHLGSPRVITNASAAIVSRHDYMPFGEEIGAGIGSRTTGMGFSVAEGLRQKFTLKERDNETGLDYFLARYYSSAQGRFTSPDESKGGPEELFGEVDPHDPLFYSDLAEPQSLNKYQYCLNNPLRYIDPDGHQTATADALKIGATLTIAGPTPLAKAAGVVILVGVGVEVTIGWNNVAAGAKGALDWASSGNTAGDASCAGCESSRRMGQVLMENRSKAGGNEVVVDANKNPESARHINDAQGAGKPSEVTIDRKGAANRRKEALKGSQRTPGQDRDEYPPAVFKEGGRGASVRPINPRDNRSSGASIGRQIRNLPDGTKVKIKTKKPKD